MDEEKQCMACGMTESETCCEDFLKAQEEFDRKTMRYAEASYAYHHRNPYEKM